MCAVVSRNSGGRVCVLTISQRENVCMPSPCAKFSYYTQRCVGISRLALRSGL